MKIHPGNLSHVMDCLLVSIPFLYPNSYVEILASKVMVLGVGAFAWWLDGESEASINGISFYKRNTQRALFCPFCCVRTHWEDICVLVKACPWARKWAFTRHSICWHLDLQFLSLQNCREMSICCLSHSVYRTSVIGLSGLRHHITRIMKNYTKKLYL